MRRLISILALLVLAAHAWAKFDHPSENDRLRALGNLFEEPDTFRYLLTPNDDFPPIKLPRSGDWLAVYPEKGQSFEEYRDSGANRPDAIHRIIYLLPIGNSTRRAVRPWTISAIMRRPFSRWR